MAKKGKANSLKCGMIGLLAACLLLSGCGMHGQRVTSGLIIEKQPTVLADPGAVEFVYEPPLIDVIDVPPGLDPEGSYYIPAHQMIVEVKQGRWRYYQQNPQ